jgi:hypothetical protein
MSPFTSSNGEQTRVFVGRKETSLLLIELETGRNDEDEPGAIERSDTDDG